MTSAIDLLRRAACSTTENPSLDPLFVCPKCWAKNDFAPDWGSMFGSPLDEGPNSSFTSHKKIIQALTGPKATTISCCKNHEHVEVADVVPEDFINPPPPHISSNSGTTNDDEKHFPVLYSKYSNFDDSEPNRDTINALFTPEATTLRRIPDHNNVAKFFGLALHKGTSLLGNTESELPVCQTRHLLPETLSTNQVVSLADLLKVLCVDPSSFSNENFQYGGALEEVLPMDLREKIVFDVALGLEYLHSQHPPIVHGDVHIGNVLITSLDPNVSKPLAKITHRRIPGEDHGESGTAETPESILQRSALFSIQGDVWNFGILVHNVVAPLSFVALKSAPTSSPLNNAAATNPGSKLKRHSHREHLQRSERFHVCSALASGKFVVDTDHCTTTSPASPWEQTIQCPSPSSASGTKNSIRTANGTATVPPPSYPLPLWARQLITLCLVADPSDRPSMTGLNCAWGYINPRIVKVTTSRKKEPESHP
ncbi:hypothetical protein Pelo_17064 [Pelomyxa schiedti]|nr:hypothetical protein Pelo_17064 [Pelomyxa schiedti]